MKGTDMKKTCCSKGDPARLNKVGGQAVLEGVMMKAGKRTVTTCRKDDGSIVVNDDDFVSVRKKHKLLTLPILRGFVNFIEMMILSMKTLNASAEALGIEEENSKFEEWCNKHLGAKSTAVIMAVALILGLGLSVFLFMFLPTWLADGFNWLWSRVFNFYTISKTGIAIIEGFLKVTIFIVYLLLVSFMKDIKRTFMYHGAEHKTIACFEAGEELTPENAAKHKRFHPRCGTSFMFLMIAIGIMISIIIRNALPTSASTYLVFAIKLATLPVTMGVGYEILMIAGKHDNFITRAISAPGMWVQKITTKEPTADMLEIAIISTKCALRDEFDEFMEFWSEKSWEKKEEASENEESTEACVENATEEAVEATETVETEDEVGESITEETVPEKDGE